MSKSTQLTEQNIQNLLPNITRNMILKKILNRMQVVTKMLTSGWSIDFHKVENISGVNLDNQSRDLLFNQQVNVLFEKLKNFV